MEGSPRGEPRHWEAQTWEADTLPTELLPLGSRDSYIRSRVRGGSAAKRASGPFCTDGRSVGSLSQPFALTPIFAAQHLHEKSQPWPALATSSGLRPRLSSIARPTPWSAPVGSKDCILSVRANGGVFRFALAIPRDLGHQHFRIRTRRENESGDHVLSGGGRSRSVRQSDELLDSLMQRGGQLHVHLLFGAEVERCLWVDGVALACVRWRHKYNIAIFGGAGPVYDWSRGSASPFLWHRGI
jgi:hypothetical protein